MILFPIFEKCKSYTLDPFWREQFSNFACNQFPQGVRYDPNRKSLIIKKDPTNTEVIALPEDDVCELFQTVIKILRSKLDMHSSRDIKYQREIIENALQKKETEADCEWKKIKPRQLRNQLLMNYLAELKNKHNLNNNEFKQLISVVQLGFQFRSINSDDVQYMDGKVIAIDNLEYDEKTRLFTTTDYPQFQSNAKNKKNESRYNKFYPYLDRFFRDEAIRVKKFTC